jgi:biopolymer transport protein ExbB
MPRSLSPARFIHVLAVMLGVALLLGSLPAPAGTAAEAPSAETPTTETVTEETPAPAPAPSARPEEQQPTLWRILRLGGWMMNILFALSIVTIALIAFHFLSLSQSNVMPTPFVAKVRDMLEKRRFSEAEMYCAQHKSVISSIVRAGLENASKKQVFLVEAMNSEGSRQASRLWQQISYLADISVIAPMCGLLGTVTGMLWTFRELAYARGLGVAQVNPTDLAGGIFQAMITTAGGLVIGIIATAFYSIFRGVVQRLVVSLEETSDRFADLLSRGD